MNTHITVKTYVIGFVLSLFSTSLAFLLVALHTASVFMILLLALVQIMVQLHFFLHLGRSRSQRANMVAFLFTALVAMIVIGGAIWIMNNLNNNMQMTPHDMDSYMRNQ